MENNVKANKEKKIPFVNILTKNIWLILLVTVLVGALGYFYCYKKVKPTYTATKSVIIRLKVEMEPEGRRQNEATNNATLSKMYVLSLDDIIKSEVIANKATEILPEYGLEGAYVSRGSIKCAYDESSMIFKISYTDSQAQIAQKKLDAVIKSASEQLPYYVEADEISLVSVQNGEGNVSVSNSTKKITVIAFAAGLALGVILAFLRFFLDNTLSDRDDLEAITGVPFLTFIEEYKAEKKKKYAVKKAVRKRRFF